ncbi:AAA family ATPase [Vibrio parahaemolyticus]|nr:AAA family ATPase [Vibrio parahaemolyticus]EHR1006005.1 ATP-binding protein [Vibrio parahaemolyticus]EIU6865415.1 ATP-binding protein [Vibrio parahaemolyticus]EIU7066083.1 ATP-binding protein [Vibrio parahaemolyticus]ELB2132452.1 ATP-binding protein [Vibrio parahaemolyticus]
MLLKFSIENFHSFKNQANVDLSSTDDPSFKKTNFGNVSPVMAIFGKNATGKTNLLKSLNFLRGFCGGRSSNSTLDSVHTYLNNSKPTKFDVEFFEDDKIYNYKLIVDSEKFISEFITEDGNLVMNRKGSIATLIDKDSNLDIDVPKEQSAIRYIERNFNDKYSYINSVSKFFYCIESNVYHNSFNIDNSSVFNISKRLSKDNFSFKLTEKLLTQFDPSLVRIELKKRETASGREHFFPIFIHKDASSEFSVLLEQESSALKRLYGILPLVLFVSAVGGVLVIDEFESHLHPTIVNKLLDLFLDFNTNNAQLILTTHQPLLMKNLSKNSIWLTEKGENGSTIQKITEIAKHKQISADNISNAYIDGKFD